MKKAFTLSEMLVCLGVIAVVMAITISVIRAKPNSNMVMFRKAYNIISNTVYELMQTGTYYEAGNFSDLRATSQKIEGEKPSGNSKFCKVFASYINTTGDVDCNSGDGASFQSNDGITWYLPPKTTTGDFSGKETIKVDVNGSDNKPNCEAGSSGCDNPDIFKIEISDIGKLYVSSDIAQKYLQSTKHISK